MMALAATLTVVLLVPAPGAAQGFFPRDAPTVPAAPSWFRERAKLPPFNPPRLPDGTPDLQGNWRGNGNATDDIEEHPYVDATTPPQESFIFDPPDGKIPYQAWALAKHQELRAGLGRGWPGETGTRLHVDPQTLCLTNVPRMAYRGNLLIQQLPGYVFITLDWGHYFRVIPTNGRPHTGNTVKTWMGESRGRWDGNTLVVDVTNLNGKMWLDSVGNFYSENVHIVERWTMVAPNTIEYEVTFEDPTVYTRPWKMIFPIRRNALRNNEDLYAGEFWEHACHEGERDSQHVKEQGYQWFNGVVPPK